MLNQHIEETPAIRDRISIRKLRRTSLRVHGAFNGFSVTNDLCRVIICLTPYESTSDNALPYHVMNSQTNITYGTELRWQLWHQSWKTYPGSLHFVGFGRRRVRDGYLKGLPKLVVRTALSYTPRKSKIPSEIKIPHQI